MFISIDSKAKAIYIQVSDTKVVKTKEIDQEVFVDLGPKGELVGIELLRPGMIEIKLILKKLAKEYNRPEILTAIRPEFIAKAIPSFANIH